MVSLGDPVSGNGGNLENFDNEGLAETDRKYFDCKSAEGCGHVMRGHVKNDHVGG